MKITKRKSCQKIKYVVRQDQNSLRSKYKHKDLRKDSPTGSKKASSAWEVAKIGSLPAACLPAACLRRLTLVTYVTRAEINSEVPYTDI